MARAYEVSLLDQAETHKWIIDKYKSNSIQSWMWLQLNSNGTQKIRLLISGIYNDFRQVMYYDLDDNYSNHGETYSISDSILRYSRSG